MLKIDKFVTASPEQWEIIIEGMRNPMNSWAKSDSYPYSASGPTAEEKGLINPIIGCDYGFEIGDNDLDLMTRLNAGGPVHAKYRRMIPVYVTLTAPLYWWKEMDTYKVGTVCNSCSTMHKIHAKEFELEDFSHERLFDDDTGPQVTCDYCEMHTTINPIELLKLTIHELNHYRGLYLLSKDKKIWYQMIQLLPTSYNQKRTLMLNYEVLHNIYHSRKNHKLDEWHTFCHWIEELPYSELIVGEEE